MNADTEMKGTMMGNVQGLEVEEILEEVNQNKSVFNMFKGLIGKKELSAESMEPILDQYRLVY